MMGKSRTKFLGLLLAGVSVWLCGSAPAPGLEARDVLLGTWVRLQDRSDDLRERLSSGGRSGPFSPEQIERMHKGVEAVRIECVDSAISIRDANREIRWISTDGRPSVDGLGSRTTARFVGDSLQVDTTNADYRREDVIRVESEDLISWSTTLEGGDLRTTTFLTVYERAAEASGPCLRDGLSSPVGDTRSADSDPPPTSQSRSPETASAREAKEVHPPSIIRILPPAKRFNQLVSGRVLIQTLTIEPAIEEVEFWLDGTRVERRRNPPFEAKLRFDDPAREQVVVVRALDAKGNYLGEDQLVLNRLDPVFRIQIVGIEGGSGSSEVTFRLSVPRKATLDRVEVYVRDELVETLRELALDPSTRTASSSVAIARRQATEQDFVRLLAVLGDGRQLEDVEFLETGVFKEEVDVQLVQLQVLVTDRSGRPVRGLTAEDFEIRDGGRSYSVKRLYPAQDLALVLGLSIDSSGSMGPLWRQTQEATTTFLRQTLEPRDRAFVVDFDTQLRLLQPLTSNPEDIRRALGRLSTSGGTALHDSILFSLLQFSGEPGRRALIVLTDGFDSASRADPERAIEFGQRLGVPVYIIAMDTPGARSRSAILGSAANSARNVLHLITDPTGGRLFHARTPDLVAHAFEQIERELRSQYILTYVIDRDPNAGIDPKVRILRKGMKVRLAIQSD